MLVTIVSTGEPYVLLNKKGETNLHHLSHFLLFTSQNAFLVQLCLMSSKQLRMSLLGESYVTSTYLAQIVWRSTNQT
jgi:hypothetical protein